MSEIETYLHGYSKKEQNRLRKQAQILEPYVYDYIRFENTKNILEVGCGVGAQTQILAKRFKKSKITGVDISKKQIESANKNLSGLIKAKRVELILGDGANLPVKDNTFDGAFLCWFLEHVPNPLRALKEVHKKLRKGGVIYCSEVQNSAIFVEPYSPAILKYWYELNDLQWSENGHPFIGAELGHLLHQSGFKKIEHNTQVMLFDSRDNKKKNAFLKYMTELMMSAAPHLLKNNRISPHLLQQVKNEMTELKKNKNSVVFFPFCRAKATK